MLFQSPKEFVHVAYKKLKQMVYFDKSQLHLRSQLAEFECATDFEQQLEAVAMVINSDASPDSSEFHKWLGEVDFYLVPKTVKRPAKIDKEKGTFVTNLNSAKQYPVERVNYIFSGPIELHLIAVLWLMTEGKHTTICCQKSTAWVRDCMIPSVKMKTVRPIFLRSITSCTKMARQWNCNRA